MRVMTVKKDNTTIVIQSPWLSRVDAARYLDISLSEFLRTVADRCPHRSFGNRRKYHVHDLDRFDPNKTTTGYIENGKASPSQS
ncbi:MAG: hypothetical protein A4E69_01880 [Syntrophus sp. PtaB.Bin138]|nr:MAG: hypothetical protein A4E69_01880 [Syntrophus sp. PtaB.Bin138]